MSFQKITKLLSKAKEAYKREGFYYVIYSGGKLIYNLTFKKSYNFIYCKSLIYLNPPGTFTFQGRTYYYFYHPYGTTWKNERAVEIPIILEKIQSYRGGKILEVGNVLSHYVHFQHDIVDKYEKANGVINQDVVDFQPAENEKYDLIVSISTIEHVGWDVTPRDSKKIPLALENLSTRCLAPEGEIVVTLPIGYNTYLDKLLKEDKIRFTEQYYLKRISEDNKWTQVGEGEIREAKYGTPFPYANALVIGIIKRTEDDRF
jgi:hypothetical protein